MVCRQAIVCAGSHCARVVASNAAAICRRADRGDQLAKQNYRQMKKQKETARKARQVEKQQRRQTRTDQPVTAEANPDPEAAGAIAGGAQIPSTGE